MDAASHGLLTPEQSLRLDMNQQCTCSFILDSFTLTPQFFLLYIRICWAGECIWTNKAVSYLIRMSTISSPSMPLCDLDKKGVQNALFFFHVRVSWVPIDWTCFALCVQEGNCLMILKRKFFHGHMLSLNKFVCLTILFDHSLNLGWIANSSTKGWPFRCHFWDVQGQEGSDFEAHQKRYKFLYSATSSTNWSWLLAFMYNIGL